MGIKKAAVKNVVICTEKRGVIFGAMQSCEPIAGTALYRVKLKEARQCLYWAKSVRGVFGLASSGPNGECRVSPPIPALEDVAHAILDTTPAASAAWKASPWSA